MARVRSPNRDKAFEIYKESNGSIANREIARILDISEKTVSGWKVKDRWNEKINGVLQKIRSTPNKKGGQYKNKNAEKHGFFSKYLPEDTFSVIQDIERKNPLNILWENIQIQYAAIIRSQKIMHVKSIDDKTIEKIEERNGDSSYGEKWEVQQAWDKQANFLNAQSRAMKTLESMIKQYDEMLNKNWDLATEEQKLRIEVLKAKMVNHDDSKEDKIDKYLTAIHKEVNNDK